MSLEENAKALSDFGLTYTQAKVYISMAKLGISSIREISKASKVRREEVYRILPKLQGLGLIETILGKPIKIRATPVKDALSILFKRERNLANDRLSQLSARRDQLLRGFNAFEMKPLAEEDEGEFALLSERDGIISRGLTMVEYARKEIDLITSVYQFYQLFLSHSKMIHKVIGKGVSVHAILDISEQNDSILKMVEGYKKPLKISLAIKYTYQPTCHFISIDNKQVLISTSAEPLEKYPYLWTRNKNIVKLMRRYFEDTWHSSVSQEDIITKDVSDQAFLFASQLRPADHLILVYDSPEAKYNVLFNYLKAGFVNKEVGVYVASDEGPIEIRQAMTSFGIDIDKLEKEGALRIFGYEDIYIIDGKFNPTTTTNLWKKLFEESLSKGFKGMRVTGEMACFFTHGLITNLLEYEKSLNRTLNLPMIAICAYNADMLSKIDDPINLYNELVRAHGTVLFTGIDKKLGRIEIRRA